MLPQYATDARSPKLRRQMGNQRASDELQYFFAQSERALGETESQQQIVDGQRLFVNPAWRHPLRQFDNTLRHVLVSVAAINHCAAVMRVQISNRRDRFLASTIEEWIACRLGCLRANARFRGHNLGWRNAGVGCFLQNEGKFTGAGAGMVQRSNVYSVVVALLPGGSPSD